MPDDVADLDLRVREQLREGVEFFKAGDLEAARRAFLEVIEEQPETAPAHLGLGQVYLKGEDLQAARQCFETALAHDPDSRVAKVMLTRLREKLGEADASEIAQSEVARLMLRGVQSLKGNDLEAARGAFSEVIEIAPETAAAHLALGQVYVKQENLPAAQECFQTALAHDPSSRVAKLMLTRVREKLGEADANEITRSEVSRLFMRGVKSLKSSDLDAAQAAFSEVIEIAPETATAHLALGQVYVQQEDPQAAQECFQTALAHDPSLRLAQVMLTRVREKLGEADANEVAQSQISRLLRRGIKSLKTSDLDGAHAAFSEIIEIAPETAAAHLGLGKVYVQEQDLPSALECLQTAATLDPKSPMAKLMLARVREQLGEADASEIAQRRNNRRLVDGLRSLKTGDIDAARAAFSQVIEANPEISAAHLGLGRVHLKEENLEAALQCFETAVSLDPSSARAKIMRARVREKLGDTDAAMEDYEDASEIDPSRGFAQAQVGRILAKNEDYAGALERLRDTVQRDPKRAMTRYRLAGLLERTGDTAAAKIEFREVLDLRPDMWMAAYKLGRLHVDDEEHGAARPLLEKAVQLAPDKRAPRLVLGVALKGLGHYAEALAAFKEAQQLRTDSGSPMIPSSLAMMIADCEIQMGQPEEALKSLRQALRTGRQPAFLHKRVGDVLMTLERYREAIEEYRAAVMREEDLEQKQPELRPLIEQADTPGQDPEPLARQIQTMLASIFAAKRDDMRGGSPGAAANSLSLELRRDEDFWTE